MLKRMIQTLSFALPVALIAALLMPMLLGSQTVFADLPPRPAPAPPVTESSTPNVAAISLVLSGVKSPTPQVWANIQWQDGEGGWHDVIGWEGGIELSAIEASADGTYLVTGEQYWTVGKAQFGQENFRWQIFNADGSELIATSDVFDLPMRNTTLTVSLP